MADFATSLPDAYRARRPTTGLNTLSPLYEEPEETPMPEWNMLPSVGNLVDPCFRRAEYKHTKLMKFRTSPWLSAPCWSDPACPRYMIPKPVVAPKAC